MNLAEPGGKEDKGEGRSGAGEEESNSHLSWPQTGSVTRSEYPLSDRGDTKICSDGFSSEHFMKLLVIINGWIDG